MLNRFWTNSEIFHGKSLTKPSEWLLNLLILFSTISFVSMWIVGQYLQISLVDLMSFNASDPSWVPEGSEMNPAVGVHYFGDYVLGRAWSIHPDPYHVMLPAYPPISLLLFKPFALLPYTAGLVAYFIVSIAVFVGAIFAWLSHLPVYVRMISSGLLAIASFPSLVALDRGNQVYLMFGLVAWGFVFWKWKKFVLAGVVIGIAIGLKFYLLPILLPLLILGAKKIVFVAGGVSFVGSMLLWQTYPGGAVYNLNKSFQLAFSPTNPTGSGTPQFQIEQTTLSSAIIQIGSLANGALQTFDSYDTSTLLRLLPLILWLLTSVVSSLQKQIPLAVSLTVVLSISQHLSSNGIYSGLWAVVAGMVLLTSDLSITSRNDSNLSSKSKKLRTWLKSLAMGTVLMNLIILPNFSYKIDLDQETGWTLMLTQTLGPISLTVFEVAVMFISVLLIQDNKSQSIRHESLHASRDSLGEFIKRRHK